jgi:hypothetical protein
VLVPDRKIALEKIRAELDDLPAESDGDSKSHSQLGWIAAALDQLLPLEDHGFYAAHYSAGLALAQEGARLTGVETPQPAQEIAALQHCLAEITKILAHHPDATAFAWLNQVTDWENALYARLIPAPRTAPPAKPPMNTRHCARAAGASEAIQNRTAPPPKTVAPLRRPPFVMPAKAGIHDFLSPKNPRSHL